MVRIDMDMPDRCTECRFRDDIYSTCWADARGRVVKPPQDRPDWCPLKEEDDER